MCDASPVPDKKAEKRGGGGFSAQFSGVIILSLELYLGTNFVPNVLKKVLSVTWLMRYRPIKIVS